MFPEEVLATRGKFGQTMAHQYLILRAEQGWIIKADSVRHGPYATQDEAMHQALALAWDQCAVGEEAEIMLEDEHGEIDGRWVLRTLKADRPQNGPTQ